MGLLPPYFHLVLLGDRNKNKLNKLNHFKVCLELLYLAQVQERRHLNTATINLLVGPCVLTYLSYLFKSPVGKTKPSG